MEPNQPLQSRIESLIDSDRVVLFMKGTRMQPQCGFSAATVGILDSLVPRYTTFNVLEDQGIREGTQGILRLAHDSAALHRPGIRRRLRHREAGCSTTASCTRCSGWRRRIGRRPKSPSATPPPPSSPTRFRPTPAARCICPSTGAGSTPSTSARWKGTRFGPSRTGSRCCSTWRRRRRRRGCPSTSKRRSRAPPSRSTIPMLRLRWAGCRRPSSPPRGATRRRRRRSWTCAPPTSGRGRSSRVRCCWTRKA